MKSSVKPKISNGMFEQLFDNYVDTVINSCGLPTSVRNQLRARLKTSKKEPGREAR
ncbi:hypothetical protein GCM10028810_37210 [Spirosoma litoris]